VNGAAAVGARAPDFDVPLVGGGRIVRDDLVRAGGGVLLFVKGDCPASELVASRVWPLVRALARGDRPFLAVFQGEEGAARDFRAALGVSLPLAHEAAPFAVSRAYEVNVVPTLFVLDGAGSIAGRLEGFHRSEYIALGASLQRALALGGQPPVLDRPEELPEVRPG